MSKINRRRPPGRAGKAAILPGWSRLWHGERLPFQKRKAEMLVSVGKELDGIDAQSFAQLPLGWSILYYLAKLGLAIVIQLVEQGRIHPQLRLAEAKALVAEFCKSQHAAKPGSNLERRFSNFIGYVRDNMFAWPAGTRTACHGLLLQLASELSQLNDGPVARRRISKGKD